MSHIAELGVKVPDRVLTNEYFSEYFKEDLSGFLEGTVGQKERHWLADNESVVDLCAPTAQEVMAESGIMGVGGTIAAMMAYNNEKQFSKEPERFGKDTIEGLAAPEAANNSASVGALIPMVTLGVPRSGTTAIMLGTLLILGLQPGPLPF